MESKHNTKKFSNGEVTIIWQPIMCIHSTNCWRGENALSQVFNPLNKPWINPNGASTSKIIEQVNKCPSGALSYYMNEELPEHLEHIADIIIEPIANGPLMVHGNVIVKDSLGNETLKDKATAFCRCGGSKNKPYCDGSHINNNFVG